LNPYDDPQVADRYDLHYFGRVETAEDQTLQSAILPLAVSAVVLDLGAGTGLVKALTDPLAYVAVDSSAPMLQHLISTHPEVFTIQADLNTSAGIRHLMEEAAFIGPFDLVTCIFSGHFIHSRRLFKAAYELLTPGGMIVHHGNMPRRRFRRAGLYPEWQNLETHPEYRADTLRERLTQAGFQDVRIVGMNAVPDWITRHLSPNTAFRLMSMSRHIPARWHFHAAGFGRKPYDR
jgi:SAM-dependent methyltransferase